MQLSATFSLQRNPTGIFCLPSFCRRLGSCAILRKKPRAGIRSYAKQLDRITERQQKDTDDRCVAGGNKAKLSVTPSSLAKVNNVKCDSEQKVFVHRLKQFCIWLHLTFCKARARKYINSQRLNWANLNGFTPCALLII